MLDYLTRQTTRYMGNRRLMKEAAEEEEEEREEAQTARRFVDDLAETT